MAIQVTFDDNDVWTWQKFGKKIAERFGWTLIKTNSNFVPNDNNPEWWDWKFKDGANGDVYMTADGWTYSDPDCTDDIQGYDLREELDIDYIVGRLTFTDGTPDEACLVVRE